MNLVGGIDITDMAQEFCVLHELEQISEDCKNKKLKKAIDAFIDNWSELLYKSYCKKASVESNVDID